MQEQLTSRGRGRGRPTDLCAGDPGRGRNFVSTNCTVEIATCSVIVTVALCNAQSSSIWVRLRIVALHHSLCLGPKQRCLYAALVSKTMGAAI